MNEDVLMFVAMVTGVVLVAGHAARVLRTRTLHRTIREALRSPGGLPPGLLDRLDEPQSDGGGDDRNGLVLLALGAALVGYALLAADAGQVREFVGIALFPIFVGAVLLVRARYLDRRAAAHR
jgi:hypothetical protein